MQGKLPFRFLLFLTIGIVRYGLHANLLPIIDDPIIVLASPTASCTPSISSTPSKTSTTTSTHTWKQSVTATVTPTISSSGNSLSYNTAQSYYSGKYTCKYIGLRVLTYIIQYFMRYYDFWLFYSDYIDTVACFDNPSTFLPERLGIGTSEIYIPNKDGLIKPGRMTIARNGITWSVSPTNYNNITSSSDNGNLLCSFDSVVSNHSLCSSFCPSVLNEVKPGTWKIYGTSTNFGSICMLIQRDFTLKSDTGLSVSNNNAQIRIAYDAQNPTHCPENNIFINGAAILNEKDIVVVYVRELINTIPNDNNQPLPSVALFSSIILIISGIFQ